MKNGKRGAAFWMLQGPGWLLLVYIVVAQGTQINRLGRIYISRDPDDPQRVLIGGETHILIEGSVYL
jgi:predicted PhzF superfamily epimerase YddE/YHI9